MITVKLSKVFCFEFIGLRMRLVGRTSTRCIFLAYSRPHNGAIVTNMNGITEDPPGYGNLNSDEQCISVNTAASHLRSGAYVASCVERVNQGLGNILKEELKLSCSLPHSPRAIALQIQRLLRTSIQSTYIQLPLQALNNMLRISQV